MYSCNKCNKNFKNCSNLMEHKTRRTPCRPPTHHCERCNKGFASYQTRWKHKLMCQGQSHNVNYPVGQKRSTDIPTESLERPNDDGLPKRSKNPKIQTLLDEIINDSSTDAEPEPSNASLPTSRPAFRKQPLPDPPAEDVFRKEDFTAKIVADAFPSTKIVAYSDTDDEESHPIAKGNIMGYSNKDNGDDDGGDDDDREEDQGLKDRFNLLFIKFTRGKQYEHGA